MYQTMFAQAQKTKLYKQLGKPQRRTVKPLTEIPLAKSGCNIQGRLHNALPRVVVPLSREIVMLLPYSNAAEIPTASRIQTHIAQYITYK
jgi:hypothetical protein